MLYQFDKLERFEIEVFDAITPSEKKQLALTMIRSVRADEPIVVKFFVQNPLMSNVEISKIQLLCRFFADDQPKGDVDDVFSPLDENPEPFTIVDNSITLRPKETKEIILEVIPHHVGEIVIEGIQWKLFNVVSCSYYFPTQAPNEHATEENTAMKLKGKEKMFHYKVLESSTSLQVEVGDQIQKEFIYSEYSPIDLKLKNPSSRHDIKDVYMIVSHPVFFGFTHKKLIDHIPAGEEFNTQLWLRAVGLQGKIRVRILIRYRVVGHDGSSIC